MSDDQLARCREMLDKASAHAPHEVECGSMHRWHTYGCPFDGDRVGRETDTRNEACACSPVVGPCSCEPSRTLAAAAAVMAREIERDRTLIGKIVAVMRERAPVDQLLSEIQDHLTIADYDVPLRGYDVDLDRALAAAKELRAALKDIHDGRWNRGRPWNKLLSVRKFAGERLAATAWLEET